MKTNKKLIDFWTKSDDDYLKLLLRTNGPVYNFPTYDEVIEYLENTNTDGSNIQNIMDDLIIKFIDEEFLLELK